MPLQNLIQEGKEYFVVTALQLSGRIEKATSSCCMARLVVWGFRFLVLLSFLIRFLDLGLGPATRASADSSTTCTFIPPPVFSDFSRFHSCDGPRPWAFSRLPRFLVTHFPMTNALSSLSGILRPSEALCISLWCTSLFQEEVDFNWNTLSTDTTDK